MPAVPSAVGDPKGRDKGQATEQSAYDVFKYNGMPVTPAPVKANDIATRLEAVAYALNDNPRGINRLVISPLCRTLIVGMAGRYHLVREEDGEFCVEEGPLFEPPGTRCNMAAWRWAKGGAWSAHEARATLVYTRKKTMRRIVA